MPGNEFGERIHNFFGQEGLSQDQHQSQVVDGSWNSFSNGLVGNQRQIDPSLIDNLKSYSTHQPGDPMRGQPSNSQHGLNLTQQLRPEYSKSLLQEHQNPANGYMHGRATRNEANVLGVDAEASRDTLSARGFTADLHKSPMRFEMGGESPVNYDFFGGQQQLNSQLPGMLQPFPRQQMTFNDMQLLKQQVMVKQMHEYQMQQQLQKQQLEARQLNSLNSNAVNGSRSSDNQSHPLINGIPLQDASSNCWQPDLMTGNTNWMHRGMSPVVQGSSTGLMITPEHGQANLLAQQFEPSLYGMPLGGANAPQNSFSSVQMNRLASQHGSANRNPLLTNQPTSFLNQGDVQDSHMLPRSTFQEKLLFSNTSVSPGSNNRPNFESFQPEDSRERNISVQEKSYMKVPENITALQKSTALDPTEEKILFGSDDNLWEAFGNSTDMSLTGNLMSSNSDLFDACPSLQSGSWSALMQSAVAETSSSDAGLHEWGSKPQSLQANNNTAPHASFHIGNRAQESGVKASNTVSEGVHIDSIQTAVQHMRNRGNNVSDKSMGGNMFHSSSSVRKNEGTEDRLGLWKAASNPNPAALMEQNNHFTQNLPMQRGSNEFGITGAGNLSNLSRDVQGNIQHHLNYNSVEKAIPQLNTRDGSQILESYASNNAGSNRMVNARDLSMLPGGKETQSGHVGVRPSIPRKFQYHPMGNIDVTDEPCREKVSHFGESKSLGQPAMNIRIDKGHVSQNDLNCTNEAFKGTGSENSPSSSTSADNQVKNASSRLELLHKVDQSQEHSLETNVSRIPEATSSAEYGGQFRRSQPSASQGFSLQLAPPSQPARSPDNVHFSMNSMQPLNALHAAPEKGGTSQSRFAPWASNPSFPQQSTYQGPVPGIPGESNVSSGLPYSKAYHQNQLMPQGKESDGSDFDQRGHSAQTPSLLNQTIHNDKGHSAEGFRMLSASQPLVAFSSPQPSSSAGMMSNSRAGISAPQHRFWNQPSKPQTDISRLHPFPTNHVDGSFSRQENKHQLSSQNGGDMSLSGRDMVNMHGLQSKDIGAKQTSDAASIFSKMAQSNHQTFGRSLPSNNLPKDKSPHDEHMAGSGEGVAPKMTVKRVEDSAIHLQKVTSKGEQQSPSRSDGLVRDGLNHKEPANQMLHFGQTDSQSFANKNHSASAGTDHQQISPQMAPSWYSQYGTFKNGLVQPVNDTGRFTPLKTGEQSSNVGSSVDGTHPVQSSKQFNVQQKSGSAPGAETPSSESLPHGATDKILKVDKPKKRKTATSELRSWNKEVMQGSQRLKTLSEAELDWVRATNRFAEKVEFETLLEDGPPIRSKRRLIYTTQLMQQLLSPPPATVISSVASSNYEFVAFTTARGTLGVACSSTSTDSNSTPLSERAKTETISDQYICKAAEDFISRTRKLETDFAGLENGTTIADLRVEVEDLEKFAVINRFARFHPSSSSMDRTVSPVRLNSQRYVTIAPMPRNIPDSVQCLSL
ncbi:unnamed protein product [Thlaspi arvense]|uniref:Uncharacterized protein n=1 Tax=Thlaspi arvense TaxID=13288 RepID=A0AAU9SVA6_THLAR|nr:unnamed protein product [Thlaspi arvense]